MELKSAAVAMFLLFLLLLTESCVSADDPGIYEIDYRGPETHSNLPPPHRPGRWPFDNRKGTMARRKSKGLRPGNGGRGEKIHG